MSLISAIRELGRASNTPNHRCVICHNHVRRRRHEVKRDWLRRRTCDENPECRIELRRQLQAKAAGRGRKSRFDLPESKVCPICELTFYRREGERTQGWQKRQTCCSAHGYLLLAQTRKGLIVPKDRDLILDDMLFDYGQGFHDMDPEPGDGGPFRVWRPDYQTYGGVGW